MPLSFEERVKNEIIIGAKVYNDSFLTYDYLVCSAAFQSKPYYIISANVDNFLHLTGVKTRLNAEDFFNISYAGNLQTGDFHIRDNGTVRHKIIVLKNIDKIFSYGTLLEEGFRKNRVSCNFAATELKLTLGFVDNGVAKPRTLLKGNKLDLSKAAKLDLVFRKDKTSNVFDDIIVGNNYILKHYHNDIKHLLSKGYQDMY